MKLYPVLVGLLLLAAPAAAQTGSPTLQLEKMTFEGEAVPGGSAPAVLDFAFHCPNPLEAQPDDWVVLVETVAPDGFTVDASQPGPIPGDICPTSTRFEFSLELTLHVPADAAPATEYPVEVRVQAVPDGDSPVSDASNSYRTSLTLTTPDAPEENGTIEPVDEAARESPGPALPLLLGALALAARRPRLI